MKSLKRIDVCCAIIEHNGHILAAKRGDISYGSGSWEFPGGKVESSETLEDCIRREIHEELSIQIQIIALLPFSVHEQPHRTIILHPFVCSYDGTKINPGEHQQIKWILPGEFHKLDWLVADKDVWENYKSFRNLL